MKHTLTLLVSIGLSGCGTLHTGHDGIDAFYNTSSAILNKDKTQQHCNQHTQELRAAC
jgi:uncharacterized protein YceK